MIRQTTLFEELYREQIIEDLFQAYFDARKNKRNTINALQFEKNFESNLFSLCAEIVEHRYQPKDSICFIVNDPVQREIFAADFRDRVIHHFIYNYISPVFEKTFINDSYSCRKGKGTHYGIKRIDHFIRSCSHNYQQECYILKLDIQGYFMSIHKRLLFNMIKQELSRQSYKIEFQLPMVLYLIEKTLFNDPTQNSIVKGKRSDWKGLPKTKSLFHAPKSKGLPIGNLTSQLFANIYLNKFDHFVKRDLKIRYYGRYVDDFILIHPDQQYLISLIPKIREFLSSELKLRLHPDKIYLQHFSKGVKFLGVVIKPFRKYIANRTKGNFYQAIAKQNQIVRDHKPNDEEKELFRSVINSYLGILRHYQTFKIRKKMIGKISGWWLNYFYCTGLEKVVSKNQE